MKKQILLLIGLITSATALAQVETYTTDYKILYEADYLRYLDAENRRSETLYLFAGAEGSVFMNHNKANAEEIKQKVENMISSGHIDFTKAGSQSTVFDNNIFKDYTTQEVWVSENLAKKDYVYKEKAAPLNWEITNETKKYEQYEVQKATTGFAGRDYVAWFTTEIPIADGPYVFSGLPGLIVELYDTQEHYKFSLLSVERLEENKQWSLNKKKPITKEEVIETKERLERNRRDMVSLMGMNSDGSDGTITNYVVNGKEVSEAELKKIFQEESQRKKNTLELE